jgi:hypothetical protein
MPVGGPGDQQPEADPLGCRGQGRQGGHALEAVARSVPVHGHEMIETPCSVEAELFTEAGAVNDLVPFHALLGNVDPEFNLNTPDFIAMFLVA